METTITKEQVISGLENREFKMYLQFIVDANTKKVASAEALCRWEHSEYGLLMPVKFLDFIERIGLINAFDYYMFEEVCKQLEIWNNDSLFGDMLISCNITRHTLSDTDFFEKIKAISEKYVFNRKKLAIEITEDMREENFAVAKGNIKKCSEYGIFILLDDIGGGYAALSDMREYKIDVVKLDRTLLLKAIDDEGKKSFCSIVEMAHSLNIKVCSEGIETEEQKGFAINSGCDFLQGWYYSTPQPIVAFEQAVTIFCKNI